MYKNRQLICNQYVMLGRHKPYTQYGPITNGCVTAGPDAAVRYRTYVMKYIAELASNSINKF